MKTIRVNVTAEDIAAADNDVPRPSLDWWLWPVKRALEALIGETVEIDGDKNDDTAVADDGLVTLVLTLDVNAHAFLDARYDRDVPGEPFFFELTLPDWLCALVDEAIDEDEPRCRVCGCSDYHACEGGCSWVPDDESEPICSACYRAEA